MVRAAPAAHVGAALLPTRSSKHVKELDNDIVIRFLPSEEKRATMRTRKRRGSTVNNGTVLGTVLANRPECRAALKRTAGYTHMQRIHAAPTAWSPSAKLVYLKTAKAGSVSFKGYFAEHFNDAVFEDEIGTEADAAALTDGLFGFTFVRDPMGRALAAYAEVDAVHGRVKDTEEGQRQLRRAGTTCAHPGPHMLAPMLVAPHTTPSTESHTGHRHFR